MQKGVYPAFFFLSLIMTRKKYSIRLCFIQQKKLKKKMKKLKKIEKKKIFIIKNIRHKVKKKNFEKLKIDIELEMISQALFECVYLRIYIQILCDFLCEFF
jgi:hypothetical protein